ncbi:hypothetical protein AAG906_006880 [Vitis piasezkii]
MTAYRFEQPELPQPAEIPAARRASPDHIPEGIPIASPTISRAPPVTPASSEPSTSAEPRMVIPISEYRDLCRTLQTLTASQSSLAQEMAVILARQEQMLTTTSHPTTAVPHSQPQSLRPLPNRLLKRRAICLSHRPRSSTHMIIYISTTYFFYVFHFVSLYEIPSF